MFRGKRLAIAIGLSVLMVAVQILRGRARSGAQSRREALGRLLDACTGDGTDLERFARMVATAADEAASAAEFVALISGIILGSSWPAGGLLTGLTSRTLYVIGRRHPRLRSAWADAIVARFDGTGFAGDDYGNQAQHFWFFVVAALTLGPTPAEIGARYHEWNPPRGLRWLPLTGAGSGTDVDLRLSRQALSLAELLLSGGIAPAEVPAWLRANLRWPPIHV
jgi:hypothetical protein